MRFESFDEIFTYVGPAPKLTPEEREKLDRLWEQADFELEEYFKTKNSSKQ